MPVSVEIDQDICIGSGNCVFLSRQAIQLDEDDVAYVANAELASREELEQAASSCPTNAILLHFEG